MRLSVNSLKDLMDTYQPEKEKLPKIIRKIPIKVNSSPKFSSNKKLLLSKQAKRIKLKDKIQLTECKSTALLMPNDDQEWSESMYKMDVAVAVKKK